MKEMVTAGLNHKDQGRPGVWELGWRSEPKPDLGNAYPRLQALVITSSNQPRSTLILIHSHLVLSPCSPEGEEL